MTMIGMLPYYWKRGKKFIFYYSSKVLLIKKVVALEGSNASDRLSINILPEILWEKLDSQSVSYPMNIIDYFCNVLFL